ncbi:hypothetical protein GQ53DRAFT_743147 [Thozetella sp. PMI_491]|nr:hypothetical protein GQ53DRAFT_743147 [Thozetella sp. PMI_491]
MSSARRIFALLAQKAGEAQAAVRGAVAPARYLPLSQSFRPTKTASLLHQPRRLLVYLAVALFTLALLLAYRHGEAIQAHFGTSRANISKEQFIAAVLRNPVEGLLDPAPIRQKCDETNFQEGLVWHCAAVNGGIGNVANMVLNCVRYAIEAGATTLILPRISLRGDNLIDLGGQDQSADMSYLLDVDYFLDSWKQACPQMRAVLSEADAPDVSATAKLSPNEVKAFKRRKYLIIDPTGWREAFDAWIAKISDFETMSAAQPVRVWQNLAFAQWNREVHSPEFGNAFPRLFRHPPQTRRLAASVLWNLEQKLGRPVVADTLLFSSAPPSPQSFVNSLGPGRLAAGGFLGAHLRVAADTVAAGWPGYEAQAPFYIRKAKELNLTTIYVATGSKESRERFREDASRESLSIVVKEDLLDEPELAELQKLTWDQQALVDFEVLMHSTWFYGFVRSSYSWAMVLRRGTLPEAGIAEWSKEEHEYRDNLSAIVGRYDSINPEGLWP